MSTRTLGATMTMHLKSDTASRVDWQCTLVPKAAASHAGARCFSQMSLEALHEFPHTVAGLDGS
eukprot:5718930-Pleurochrysis_carterae.AAC.2